MGLGSLLRSALQLGPREQPAVLSVLPPAAEAGAPESSQPGPSAAAASQWDERCAWSQAYW